jgi:O-acetyl-ADP-ribose deacetylase (regulator of RNase III)
MGTYKEIDGNLITLALDGTFDVIVHGANCFCTMGAGIAPQMAKAFGCDTFKLEGKEYAGDINKLGQIDFETRHFSKWDQEYQKYPDEGDTILRSLVIINAYTQYHYGSYRVGGVDKPIDYDAITLCMRKINHIFKGKTIGLPYVIGCGLAGGDINIVLPIIKNELKDMNVIMVKFNSQ